jgi:hypothetical protein
MQQIINQLILSVDRDRKSIETIQEQIKSINIVGLDELKKSTLESLYQAVCYLQTCVDNTRLMIVDLTHKYTVKQELSWSTKED